MNSTVKKTTVAPEQFVLYRRIGSPTYKVGIHFNEKARETLEDKILRLLKNDLNLRPKNATMEALQAGWLPERKVI